VRNPSNNVFSEFLRDATRIRPQVVLDAIKAGESLEVKDGVKVPIKSRCTKCDYISSQSVCKACLLLEGLNTGRPLLGIGKSKDGKIKKYKGMISKKNECTPSGCESPQCTKVEEESSCSTLPIQNLKIIEASNLF
jgi:hypothetical protein